MAQDNPDALRKDVSIWTPARTSKIDENIGQEIGQRHDTQDFELHHPQFHQPEIHHSHMELHNQY